MSANLYRLAVLGFTCALAAPASAQLLTEKSLSAAMAMTNRANRARDLHETRLSRLGARTRPQRRGPRRGARRRRSAAHDGEQPAQGLHFTHVSHPIGRICPARKGQSHNRRGAPDGDHRGAGRFADQGRRRGHRRGRRVRSAGWREGRSVLQRLASTRSPISSSEGYPQPIAVIAGPEGRP